MKRGVFDPHTLDLFGYGEVEAEIVTVEATQAEPAPKEGISQKVMDALQGALMSFSPKAMLIPRYK